MRPSPPTAAETRPRWQVASALGITQIFSFGTSYYLHGVLGGPIREEMGWSLAFLAAAQSAGMLVAGFVAPAVGRAINARGGRSPLIFGFLMFALGLSTIGLSTNKTAFVLGWLVLGIGMGASFYDGVFAALGKLYGRSARQPISTVTLWGGFASTICWPLSAVLLEPIGWRGICFVYAAIHLVLCISLVRWSLKADGQAALPLDEPADAQVESDTGALFYLLMGISVVAGMSMTVIYVHLIQLLESRGLALVVAVSLGTLIGPSQVSARAIDMAIGARHHPAWTLLASLALIALGTMLFASDFPVVGLAIVLFSAGNGVYSIVRGALPLALFGPQRYAVVIGRLAQPLFIAQALSPTIGALMISELGTGVTLWLIAMLCVFNFCAGLLLFTMVRR